MIAKFALFGLLLATCAGGAPHVSGRADLSCHLTLRRSEPVAQFQGEERKAPEGDREPEVDQAPAEYACRGRPRVNPEAGEHRD